MAGSDSLYLRRQLKNQLAMLLAGAAAAQPAAAVTPGTISQAMPRLAR